MKAFDIALKDLSQSLRSVFLIGMTIVAPLVITGLLYFAFGGMSSGKTDLPKLQVGIVNQDAPVENQPALGQMIVDMFHDPSVAGWLSAREIPDEDSDDEEYGEYNNGDQYTNRSPDTKNNGCRSDERGQDEPENNEDYAENYSDNEAVFQECPLVFFTRTNVPENDSNNDYENFKPRCHTNTSHIW